MLDQSGHQVTGNRQEEEKAPQFDGSRQADRDRGQVKKPSETQLIFLQEIDRQQHQQ